jgi:hypothetical protein
MFENKFNSKKADPLVEAAKGAMMEGEIRRQAINAVNEAFGVYNRNAVVREHLAAYDAAIEEAYKNLKEKKGCYEEGNDGNLANNYPPYDKVTRGDVIAGRLGKDQMGGKKKVLEKKGCYEEGKEIDYSAPDRAAVTSGGKPATPAQTTSAPQDAPMPPKRPASLQELKAPTGKTARQVMDRAERRDDEEGNWTRSNRLYKSMKRRYPGKSARNQKDTGKADLPDVGNIEFHKAGYPGHVTKAGKLTKAASRDTKDGIKSRLGKHTKPHLPEETIEEAVSRKHFQQVADLIKGHESQEKRNELASHHAGIFAKQNPRFDHAKFHKAAGSTAHEEPKKMEEAAYSAKAGRAGKNLGKKGPGTGFASLAKKAAKEYGSEESGKRVAGAILKKIRAKHMEEQVTLMPTAAAKTTAAKAPIIPKSALAPGQSLRDYMNAKQGLTRRDAPSTTPKPAASTSAPKPAASTGSMQSTPGVGATAAKPAAGLTTKNTPAFNAAQNASEPDQNKELGKPAEKSQSNFLQSQGIGVKPAEKPDTMPKIDTGPKPDSNPDQGHIKLTQTQPKDITQKNSPSYKSAQDSLAESVQVGANRYRIV